MSNSTSDRGEERYVRWQKLAIEQLGIVINLFLTFAAAILAFAVKTMMGSTAVFPEPASAQFHRSLVALGVSIGFALVANLTRALDFRYTRRAALHAWKPEKKGSEDASGKADTMGKVTWCCFVLQTVFFGVGAYLLCISIYGAYGSKI